jgi:hypothetical protein
MKNPAGAGLRWWRPIAIAAICSVTRLRNQLSKPWTKPETARLFMIIYLIFRD